MGKVWVFQMQEKHENIKIGMHSVSLRNNEDIYLFGANHLQLDLFVFLRKY